MYSDPARSYQPERVSVRLSSTPRFLTGEARSAVWIGRADFHMPSFPAQLLQKIRQQCSEIFLQLSRSYNLR